MLRFRSALPILRGARLSFLCLLAFAFCVPMAEAKRRKHSPAPSPSPQAKEDLGLKNIPLTIGHEAKGLVLPNYDEHGNLVGRFEADTASRIDENHVRFTNLKMQTFDEHQKPDFNIAMTDAVLNLETRVIESNARTHIKRADFQIAGDTMHFNTKTHEGTLHGHVHMTIFDRSQLAGKPKS
jgi:lipopolysaccharide assembly outer membrane protein LptD (OstA)